MPAKAKKVDAKKGATGKIGKDDSKKGPVPKGPGKQEEPEATEKELLLKEELDAINQELEDSKAKVAQLRQDNEWLQDEARKVRLENHEYMAYMEKKANKRQTAIISLSDQHQKELEDLKTEQRQMTEDFEKKKEALMETLLVKENILAKVNRELDELHEYKVLQQEQTATIRDLEKQIIFLRAKHSDTIQQMKTMFLAEKQDFQASSQQKITDMTKQANKDAVVCLNEHTEKVKQQNRQLRKELLLLIRKTQALYEHKRRLEEQRQQLVLERQYADDLRNIRSDKRQKALTMGPSTGDARSTRSPG